MWNYVISRESWFTKYHLETRCDVPLHKKVAFGHDFGVEGHWQVLRECVQQPYGLIFPMDMCEFLGHGFILYESRICIGVYVSPIFFLIADVLYRGAQ